MTPAESPTPYVVQHRDCRCADAPKELLFEWSDGEDVQKYEIAKYFEAHVALDYLEVLETRGPNPAFRWAMIHAIGHRGWAALRSPGMDDATFDKIVQIILDRVRGAASRSGPKD